MGGQKLILTFWVRGYVSSNFTTVNLVFGRPGFETRMPQILGAYRFANAWSARTYSASFEQLNIFLLMIQMYK